MGWRDFQAVPVQAPIYEAKAPRQIIKEMIIELNQYQWPEGIFSAGMPDYSEIDAACLAEDIPRLQTAIAKFKLEALEMLKARKTT